jgi:hypothetical protein
MHTSPGRASTRLAPLAVVTGLALALLAPLAAPTPVSAAEPDFPPNMSGYHNLPEMVAEIQQAALDHPDIVSLFSIGKSYQGRDIWMAKVSDNVTEDETEPEVLVDALHHAREHFTTEQALVLLRWLTDEYGTDSTITSLVKGREIFIIFALNPDGMRYDLTGDPFRAWRKNRQPNAGSTAVGTDLNRNYDYRWGCCGGSSGSPSAITYRGPAPWSAPEVRALRDFVNSRVVDGVQQIRTHVTLHTNGQLILYPYGYTRTNQPSDMSSLDRMTFEALAKAQASRNGYKAQQSSDLYVTDGDQIDWMYGRHRIFSFTYELYPPESGTVWGDHYPDDSRIAAQTERNRTALLHLISRASCPYQALGDTVANRNCGPLYDDLEINRGWKRNAAGTDTATLGVWAISNPAPTSSSGPKQLGTTYSGSKALVTGAAAGTSAGANDLDGGVTTIRSRPITLPADPAGFGDLSFRYSFAHSATSSTSDWLRMIVEAEDGTQTVVFEELGGPQDDDAAWVYFDTSIADWAGQRIRLIVEARDGGSGNLVEAMVDDIRIRRP